MLEREREHGETLEGEDCPYRPPSTIGGPRVPTPSAQNPPLQNAAISLSLWFVGTFSLSMLVGLEWLVPTSSLAPLFAIAVLGGLPLGILGALATPYSHLTKGLLVLASIILFPVQIVVVGGIALALTGFEGVH